MRKAFDEEFQKLKKIKILPTKQRNFGAVIKSAMAQFHEQKQCLDQYIQTLPFTVNTSFIEVVAQVLSQKVDELFNVKAQQDSYDVLHGTSGVVVKIPILGQVALNDPAQNPIWETSALNDPPQECFKEISNNALKKISLHSLTPSLKKISLKNI